MSNQSEKCTAEALAGASLGMSAIAVAAANARGVFTAKIVGPREHCRAEYLLLRDQLYELEESGQDDAAKAIADKMKAMEEVKYEDTFENTVVTVGKNYLLDNGLAGSSYTATFYMGLISSTSYSAIAAADTMSSHGGWLEAGNANTPAYSGNRKTTAWSSASSGSKALSAALTFAFTGSGTVKGCFITTVNTVDGTTGTLYSAGLFTGGDKTVANGDSLSVSYTASL
jgi:hypothetical protein